jgi:hypothetical protein
MYREDYDIQKADSRWQILPITSRSDPFAKFLPKVQVTLVTYTDVINNRLNITSDFIYKFMSWCLDTENSLSFTYARCIYYQFSTVYAKNVCHYKRHSCVRFVSDKRIMEF